MADQLKLKGQDKEKLDKLMDKIDKITNKSDAADLKVKLENIAKDKAQNNASYLKNLELLSKLLDELKNRVEKHVDYGVADEEITRINKEEIPSKYRNLVNKYFESISGHN